MFQRQRVKTSTITPKKTLVCFGLLSTVAKEVTTRGLQNSHPIELCSCLANEKQNKNNGISRQEK